jgi:taspase (threonine aspartase 1)
MSVVTHDFLVSHTAKSRWLRWQHDLETDRKQEAENAAGEENDHRSGSSSSSASFTSTLNYAVPATPSSTAHCNIQPKDKGSLPADSTTLGSDTTFVDADGPSSVYSPERSQVAGMIQKQLTISTNSPGQDEDDGTSGDQALLSSDGAVLQTSSEPQFTHSTKLAAQVNTNSMSIADMQAAAQVPGLEDMCSGAPKSYSFSQDSITDTIGAIAIDCFGNIAAGSSSGGIGMKHRGRVGPAALVGIGTAVVPVDPKDPDETSVAVVTSGTGEHIATTMAASVCANRVYFSDRKDEIGMTENVTEDEAIKSMVDLDFMGKSNARTEIGATSAMFTNKRIQQVEHPGVKNSHCEAAIGVMAVKKTKEGIYLYFCHNTESFVSRTPIFLVNRSD